MATPTRVFGGDSCVLETVDSGTVLGQLAVLDTQELIHPSKRVLGWAAWHGVVPGLHHPPQPMVLEDAGSIGMNILHSRRRKSGTHSFPVAEASPPSPGEQTRLGTQENLPHLCLDLLLTDGPV